LSLLTKRSVYPLLVPAALLLLSAFIVWQWSGLTKHIEEVKELRALVLILPLLPYVLFATGIILGWRFNNAGLILTCLALGLAYFTLSDGVYRSPGHTDFRVSMSEAARILLPWNLSFFATLTRRRLLTSVGLLCVGVILLQVFFLLLFCQTLASPLSRLISEGVAVWPLFYRILADYSAQIEGWLHQVAFWGFTNLLIVAAFSFATAFIFLAVRFARSRDALSAGFLGSLVLAFLGLSGNRAGPADVIYFSAAGLALVISAVDVSFSMAYLDELTGLPARRSLNNELLNLGRKYVIAMIDIDHFKKFNDLYGHKTGDQVLKMIASKLKDITGGAKVFRYGGEEFTAILSGKSVDEALPHLEVYRKLIESTPFVIRGNERRVRSTDKNGRVSLSGKKSARVTVSIGAAASGKDVTMPEEVLKEADRILYKAKKAGRNRVAT
jgi:diguanylate cyclase (GGDEF)-like protein